MATSKVHFSIIDIIITLVSLTTFVLDVSTDALVCIQLLLNGQNIWGCLMAVFIVVPAILMSVFSLTWHIHDKTVTPCIVGSHLLLVAPAERYVNVIRLGVNSYKSRKVVFTQKALMAQSDVSILRLIEAFLEAAPQLVLQLYILVYHRSGNWFTGVSAGCSLVSMTWAMTAYCDSQRRAHTAHYRRRLIRLVLHWGWQLFMAGGRISAFVFFACALHSWVFAVMGGHWLIAFVWISVRGTDFGDGSCERWMFRLVCGFIYIFVFLNLNDGSSRWRLTAYYLLVLVENAAMVAVYVALGDDSDMILTSCLVVFGGFFIGLMCMLVYYAFLHPSGTAKGIQRFLKDSGRTTDVSRSLGGTTPQVYSIESPNPLTVMESTGIDLSLNTSSSRSSAITTQQTWIFDRSSEGSQSTEKPTNLSKQTLQLAWQSGMGSSSGSSSISSLASNGNGAELGKRTPSVKSENSHGSVSSNNCLLPPKLKRNNLSKSPKKSSKSDVKGLDYSKRELSGDISENDNLNVQSAGSRSPTLSRSSWARSSDHNRQSLVMEDFTVLGFDDSSSLDRRNSDCSSFNSQLRSLSPLNASGMWKDPNTRLRATIAATVAAATGNPSSNEGTPNRSQSVSSYNSTVSVSEDSLNSSHNNISALNHNTAFMDSASSFKDKSECSQDAFPTRDALVSLPDIIEALEQEHMSDFETQGSCYQKSAIESVIGQHLSNECDASEKKPIAKSPAAYSKESNSPYPQDSTLTASKLETKRSTSYIASQKNGFESQNLGNYDSMNVPIDLNTKSPPRRNRTVPKSHEEKKHSGDSPFSDQELCSVMAKSLQSYIGGTSSGSQNPEREGLALTLEDLRISRETTPSQSPLSKAADDSWKSRSASSLFHDSTESSPVSSASKMNQATSVGRAEAKLSPNALRQLDDASEKLETLGLGVTLHDPEGRALAVIPSSLALKFIMEAYGSTTVKSPHMMASLSQKSSHGTPFRNNNSKPGQGKFTADSSSHGKRMLSNYVTSRSDTVSLHESSGENRVPSLKAHLSSSGPTKQHVDLSKNYHESRPKVSAEDLHFREKSKQSQARSGVSITKKLNVHFNDFPILEYESSPFHQRHKSQEAESDSGSEIGGYVAGQYCPPLCGDDDSESEENSIQRNLDYERRRNSYDLNSIKKAVLHNFTEGDSPCKQTNLADGNEYVLNFNRKQFTKSDAEHENGESAFLHLHQLRPSSSKNKFSTTKSQPNLRHHSPAYKSGNSTAELSIHGLQDKNRLSQRQDHTSHGKYSSRDFNQASVMGESNEDELYLSAKHVADYFSEALDSALKKPCYRRRPQKHCSQPQLHVYSTRQPLQRLDNSQYVSPGGSTFRTNVQKRKKDTPIGDQSFFEISNCPMSPNEFVNSYNSQGVQNLKDIRDFPKQKLMFDSPEGADRSLKGKASARLPSKTH